MQRLQGTLGQAAPPAWSVYHRRAMTSTRPPSLLPPTLKQGKALIECNTECPDSQYL